MCKLGGPSVANPVSAAGACSTVTAMTPAEIVDRRLRAQAAVASSYARPADVVRWLCAVQAQDYAGSLWGIGLRTKGATEALVERAIAERAIVRTWPMRGTLHFVMAEDIRWITGLLAPRVVQRAAARHRQLDLDERAFTKSRAILEKALVGGKSLTRPEAYDLLRRSGIAPDGQRGIHILIVLAMRGILCFGPRRGRQPTFVLLDEWIPKSRVLERDEALGELARRYFASHGPATLSDFAWWTGLNLGEAKHSVAIAGDAVVREGGAPYWTAPSTARAPAKRAAAKNGGAPLAHLLPSYDEYTVAYRDRSAFLDPIHAKRTGNGIFSPIVLYGGRIIGTWRRQAKRDCVIVAADLIGRQGRAERRALDDAVQRYGEFVGLVAELAT
jgi:hypothetical protein